MYLIHNSFGDVPSDVYESLVMTLDYTYVDLETMVKLRGTTGVNRTIKINKCTTPLETYNAQVTYHIPASPPTYDAYTLKALYAYRWIVTPDCRYKWVCMQDWKGKYPFVVID